MHSGDLSCKEVGTEFSTWLGTRLLDLIPAQFRIVAVCLLLVMLAGGSAALAWTVQGWRYGQQLERQARFQADTPSELARHLPACNALSMTSTWRWNDACRAKMRPTTRN